LLLKKTNTVTMRIVPNLRAVKHRAIH